MRHIFDVIEDWIAVIVIVIRFNVFVYPVVVIDIFNDVAVNVVHVVGVFVVRMSSIPIATVVCMIVFFIVVVVIVVVAVVLVVFIVAFSSPW